MLSSCQEDLIDGVFIIDLNQSGNLTDICIVSEDEIVAVGGDPWSFSFLASSLDQGQSWEVDSLTNKLMFDIDAQNAELYTGGIDGQIHQRSDAQWDFIRTTEWGFIRGLHVLDDGSIITLGGHAYRLGFINKLYPDQTIERVYTEDIEFSDVEQTSSGHLIASAYGKLFYSLDDGDSWNLSNGTGDFFKDIIVGNELVFAVGNNGLILKSSDEGLTWDTSRKLGSVAQSDRLEKGAFVNDQEIWIVGKSGLVLKSVDAGDSWSQSNIDTNLDLTAIAVSGAKVFIGGNEGYFCFVQL